MRLENSARPRTRRWLLVLAACLAIAPSCLNLGFEDAEKEYGRARISESELEALVFELGERIRSEVNHAALSIARATEDPEIRSRALQWSLGTTRESLSATDQPDAYAALIDLWVLCAQKLQFFESGAGQDLFGEYQSLAIDVSRRMTERTEALVEELHDEALLQSNRALVRDWVANNPIEGPELARESTRPLWAAADDRPGDVLASVRDVDDELRQISRRIGHMLTILPNQVVLEAILVLEYYLERFEAPKNEVIAAMQKMVALAEDVPELVESERTAALDRVSVITEEALSALRVESKTITLEIDRQRQESMRWLGEERNQLTSALETARTETLDHLTEERRLLTEDIEQQRLEMQSFLRQERLETLEAIDAQRRETLPELERMISQTVREASHEGQGLLDRALLAAGIFGAITLAVAIWLTKSLSRR